LFANLPVERRQQVDREAEAILDEIERTSPADASRFVIDRGADELYRWQLIAQNGEVLAQSAHGFGELSECRLSIDRLRVASSVAVIEDAA
jgi:uncharacterized protein YegP (UPF0339 family)